MASSENVHLSLKLDAAPDLHPRVVHVQGFEQLARPYEFRVTFVTTKADHDFDTWLASRATLRIDPASSPGAPIHGVFASIEELGSYENELVVRAALVPEVWNLSLRKRF